MSDIKKFVGKFVRSPIKTTIVAYLIWKILKPHTEGLTFPEGIKVLKSEKDKELIFDDETKMYAVIKGNDFDYFSTQNEAEKYFNEGVKMKKLERLHESIFSEAVKPENLSPGKYYLLSDYRVGWDTAIKLISKRKTPGGWLIKFQRWENSRLVNDELEISDAGAEIKKQINESEFKRAGAMAERAFKESDDFDLDKLGSPARVTRSKSLRDEWNKSNPWLKAVSDVIWWYGVAGDWMWVPAEVVKKARSEKLNKLERLHESVMAEDIGKYKFVRNARTGDKCDYCGKQADEVWSKGYDTKAVCHDHKGNLRNEESVMKEV